MHAAPSRIAARGAWEEKIPIEKACIGAASANRKIAPDGTAF
jgi:hypothetical protein